MGVINTNLTPNVSPGHSPPALPKKYAFIYGFNHRIYKDPPWSRCGSFSSVGKLRVRSEATGTAVRNHIDFTEGLYNCNTFNCKESAQ